LTPRTTISSVRAVVKKSETVQVVVLGGAGAMGRITIKDLFETSPDDFEIVIADYDEKAAKALAKSYKSKRVRAEKADVTDVAGTAKLLSSSFCVINSVHHKFNVDVMRASLQAGCNYMDLGGLFHFTQKQVLLHKEFEKAGLLALLGMGAAPGITNILARSSADTMEQVREVHTIVATADDGSTEFAPSYSVLTILEEASAPAAFFTKGKMSFVDALSGAEPMKFPKPVGTRSPGRTIHSEVATLSTSYKKKGVQEVSFKIAFPDAFRDKLLFLQKTGLLASDPVRVNGADVVPFDVTAKVLSQLPKPSGEGEGGYEIVRAVVRGVRDGQAVEDVVDCHVEGMPEWGFGVDVDTGSPPSIGVQMMARGQITAKGALPPELCVPAKEFFAELPRRRMSVKRKSTRI
jgi:saccharopine dehydrogenase (NAD+, L-lysine-forming)